MDSAYRGLSPHEFTPMPGTHKPALPSAIGADGSLRSGAVDSRWYTYNVRSKKMKTIITTIFLILCATSFADEKLPTGIEVKVAESGDVVIFLNEDQSVIVKQAKKGGSSVIVANLNKVLSTLQLAKGGKTPVGVEYTDEDRAKITVSRARKSLIIDEDGDGIPDLKIDETGGYRVKKIEWEKVPKKPKDKDAKTTRNEDAGHQQPTRHEPKAE